ncbi:hypothetical protein STBA_63360 [Streptomyces sp. MP131-18]|nr:hypothetical protein STBA_63360 [Streptomyces sp. MP131-18]
MPRSVTRCRATRRPSVPEPPVISTVPSAANGGSPPARGRSAASSRGTETVPARTASCGSPAATAAATRSSASGLPSPSASISVKRPGCSVAAERTRPHTAAATGSVTASSGPAATAPRVTTASRRVSFSGLASQSCTVARALQVSACTATGTSFAGVCGAPKSTRTVVTCSAGPSAAGSGVQTRRYRPPPPAAVSWRSGPAVARSRRAATSATGLPCWSCAVRDTSPLSARRRATRSVVAPAACRVTPCQTNGRRHAPSAPTSTSCASACSAASSRAGCSAKSSVPCSAASSGSVTSANNAPSPPRQTAVNPWNAGPYPKPPAARWP